MSLAILSLGIAVPETRLPQTQAEAVTRALTCHEDGQAEVVHVLYRQTGIANRHICFGADVVRDVLEGTTHTGSPFLPKGRPGDFGPTTRQRMDHYVAEALPLAERAARRALEESGIAARAITYLVTVSCTGFAAPGVDIGLINRLGLPATVQRTNVGFMGCHGALNGLRVARALAETDTDARILLCCVELCSLHYHYNWDPKRLVANALFGDGAAALVGARAVGEAAGGWACRALGSCLFPNSEFAMTWHIGDHGFDMTLSTKVPNLIAAHLKPWLEDWLGGHGLRIDEVGSWAVHPGGPRVLTDVERALGLPEGATAVSREVLHECGNMSSPTVLFLLQRLRQRRAPLPCVALGFGPGLVCEAALFGT